MAISHAFRAGATGPKSGCALGQAALVALIALLAGCGSKRGGAAIDGAAPRDLSTAGDVSGNDVVVEAGPLETGGDGSGDATDGDAADGSSDTTETGGEVAPETPSACSGCRALEQCWNDRLCVAKLVTVPSGFSIDATEVTRAQYAAWLATTPATKGQASACAWNVSFVPDVACMARPSVCQGNECGQHPQPCVDACDAAAYCKAVGKKLCGALTGDDPVPSTARNAAGGSRWFNACTSDAANEFTYGPMITRGNCNDYLSPVLTTVPVASNPKCQSPVAGYAGVFDLIGNLWEWEDNCKGVAGEMDPCSPRGISFGIGAAWPWCGTDYPTTRVAVEDNVGFRCCSP